jgi:hypothetical protein
MKKDLRKTLKKEKIEINDTCVFIDGKYDPSANSLKVYRYYGNINVIEDAIKLYATQKQIDKVTIMMNL